MKERTKWSGPDEIRSELLRKWNRGLILRRRVEPPVDNELSFPLTLRLRRPAPRELGHRFDDVRRWIAQLERGSKEARGFGYSIVWTDVNPRDLGRNRIPSHVVVTSEDDALRLIGKHRQAEQFTRLAVTTILDFPELADWLGKKPLQALENADDWDRILGILRWFRQHPRASLYLRQLDIAGVDTKFIEARRGLLSELLDRVLRPEDLDLSATGAQHFERRYGMLQKQQLVRFRILDAEHYIQGLSDISIPASQFATLSLPVRRVFITENEINGLAFPRAPSSIVIFGLGYDLPRLAEAVWLRDKSVYYWGDIDTHGFAMLDRLRELVPATQSMLMDAETLLQHRALWVREDRRHERDLLRLSAPEAALYDELRFDHLGPSVRLEQERIGYNLVEGVVERLINAAAEDRQCLAE